jgi:Tfp pilus assembly protein PilX
MKIVKLNTGAVLVTALLFLNVITLLVLITIEVVALQIKMSNFSFNKLTAFAAAEEQLAVDEEKLAQGKTVPRSAELISDKLCAVKFYRVTVSAQVGVATTSLRSTFAQVGDASKCVPKPTITTGRQSWRELL